MSKINLDLKPFYIYTTNNTLFIKNINENTFKLSNNIYKYCASVDSNNTIHICSIDTHGKLLHFYNSRGHWKKNTICKAFNNIKSLNDIRLFIVNNMFNVFTVECSSLDEDMYRVSHFNFYSNNPKVNKYHIDSVIKDKESIYKINIDDYSNIVFEYKQNDINFRSENNKYNTLIFNINSRTWTNSNSLLKSNDDTLINENEENIKNSIFEYCYSINYKL